MSWDPVGIDVSPSFRRYVERLRETWPVEETLAASSGDESTSGSSTQTA